MLAWITSNLEVLPTTFALGLGQVQLLGDLLSTVGADTFHQVAIDGLVLAQNTDADLVAQAQAEWKTFVETGQIWAFLIGTIIGYTFRVFTTYG